jgi:dihydroorotase
VEIALVLRGGEVVDESGRRPADVAVGADGTIVAVGPAVDADGARVLDCDGAIVAPGFVDLHTHLREPGREEAETVESGSRAAALGGYTAVVAMPNTEPAIDSAAVVRQVLDAGRGALCEVAVAGAITVGRKGESLSPMAEMADLGVRLFTDDGDGRWSTPPRSGSRWPSTARTPDCRPAGTCTRGSGRAGSASPGCRRKPRSSWSSVTSPWGG